MSKDKDKRIHVTKRVNERLTEEEKDEMEKDFIEYCAIHNIDVGSFRANRWTTKAYVDQLGFWYPDWSAIPDWNAFFKTPVFKSLVKCIEVAIEERKGPLRGKIAKRKNELDHEPDSSSEDEQIQEKPVPPVTRRGNRPGGAKKVKKAPAIAVEDVEVPAAN